MSFDIKSILEKNLESLEDYYEVCGIIDKMGLVYPLGADTKVLSTVFELITRPYIYKIAENYGFDLVEPNVQNHYPDFTLHKDLQDTKKIAIDVKTTYRNKSTDKFSYTLGGYTSFIREGNETKNIVFPFNHYESHWIVGFVYNRIAEKKAASHRIYDINKLKEIPLPFQDVEVFVQEKWKISSDRAGSGNTTNIGSIYGKIEDFRAGKGIFKSEEEFLEYWRNYARTKKERENLFNNIYDFRNWKKKGK